MIFNIIQNKPLPIYSKAKIQWIYVDDHCEVLIKLFFKGKKEKNIILGQVLIVIIYFW